MKNNLLKLLPPLKRARGYYLYDEKGNRFLDLYLDKGRAIGGHRPSGLSLALKNTLSRGLYAPYPSVYEGRLGKMILKEFPQFNHFTLFSNVERLEAYLGEAASVPRWRPYEDFEGEESLILSFPFPGSQEVVLLSRDKELPTSDSVPPYILSGLIRSFYDLKKRISEADRQSWEIIDKTGHWERKGPYLKPLCKEEEYEAFFKLYLDCGILISPTYSINSICGADLQAGDFRKLLKKLGEK